jgi:hypothetical protein
MHFAPRVFCVELKPRLSLLLFFRFIYISEIWRFHVDKRFHREWCKSAREGELIGRGSPYTQPNISALEKRDNESWGSEPLIMGILRHSIWNMTFPRWYQRGYTENGARRQEKVRLWEGDPQALNTKFLRCRRETTRVNPQTLNMKYDVSTSILKRVHRKWCKETGEGETMGRGSTDSQHEISALEEIGNENGGYEDLRMGILRHSKRNMTFPRR